MGVKKSMSLKGRKLLSWFNAVIDSVVTLLVSSLSGLGMYHLTSEILRLGEAAVLVYTLGITASTGIWVSVMVYRELEERGVQH